jgi:hypothetical protein
VDISENVGEVKAKFSYSVKWTPTTISFENRLQRYERFPLNPVHLEVRACCCRPAAAAAKPPPLLLPSRRRCRRPAAAAGPLLLPARCCGCSCC